jgi:putative RNA 2'-phosphotransferase
MSMHKAKQLARFIQYAIGRCPDEFGLVTDLQGFIPVSDLLKVAHEEGWHHTRRNHLETLSYHLGQPLIEFKDHLVRVVDRSRLDGLRETANCPKLVYAPIRRRAYETVLQHGLRPQGHTGQVVLFADQGLAQKVGRRRDSDPVIVTVQVQRALARGHVFRQFGERLYLTDTLPAESCRLPRPPQTSRRHEKAQPEAPPSAKTPGSFTLDIEPLVNDLYPGKSRERERRSKDWKKERQRARRLKVDRNYPR